MAFAFGLLFPMEQCFLKDIPTHTPLPKDFRRSGVCGVGETRNTSIPRLLLGDIFISYKALDSLVPKMYLLAEEMSG